MRLVDQIYPELSTLKKIFFQCIYYIFSILLSKIVIITKLKLKFSLMNNKKIDLLKKLLVLVKTINLTESLV